MASALLVWICLKCDPDFRSRAHSEVVKVLEYEIELVSCNASSNTCLHILQSQIDLRTGSHSVRLLIGSKATHAELRISIFKR